MDQANKRLRREYQIIMRSPPPNIIAKPNMTNILEWHYVIFGPEGTPYQGGVYHGKLKFPPEFPNKPPAIMILTPNGRFKTDTRICLSMSDFHPELWNPMWSVSSILTGLLSFMLEQQVTTGSLNTPTEHKKRCAEYSMTFNKSNPVFVKHFPELVDDVSREKAQLEATNPSKSTSGSTEKPTEPPAPLSPPPKTGAPPAKPETSPNLAFFLALFLIFVAFFNYMM